MFILHIFIQTTDCKRYWVRGLRYIKSYWSKRKIRETIISEEKERELLERILKEDEDDGEVRHVTHLLCHVTCLLCHVTCLLSHVSCFWCSVS